MDDNDCLRQEELADYLDGGLDPAIKTVTEVHLLTCDKCRQSLAQLMRVMNDEVTPEEASIIRSVNDHWAGAKVGGGMIERPAGGRFTWLLAVAAVLIVALISTPFLLDRGFEPASGEEVVQLMLSQRRPFEAQLSGQPHLPIIRTRSQEEAAVSFDLLDREMEGLAADNYQMGRFYLIQKDFARAVSYLRKSEQEAGRRAEYHNDLGAAYMESGDASLLGLAEQEFQHALALNPAFAPSIFNRAIFFERTGKILQAEAELQHFLILDPSSAWAAEARSKLEGFSR
jgi:hypothetical protein